MFKIKEIDFEKYEVHMILDEDYSDTWQYHPSVTKLKVLSDEILEDFYKSSHIEDCDNSEVSDAVYQKVIKNCLITINYQSWLDEELVIKNIYINIESDFCYSDIQVQFIDSNNALLYNTWLKKSVKLTLHKDYKAICWGIRDMSQEEFFNKYEDETVKIYDNSLRESILDILNRDKYISVLE